MNVHTPWGPSQSATTVADGIVFHSTASHGGFLLDEERLKTFRESLPTFRPFNGHTKWFEEDCDACAVVVVFRDAFSPDAVANAIRMIRYMANRNYPAHWEEVERYVDENLTVAV